MDYSVTNDTGTGKKIDLLSASQGTSDNGKNDKGLTSLKQGQQVTGTVVAVGDMVTLDFDGQKVNTPKSVLGNVKTGDVKNFEVVKATGSEIQLKVLDGDNNSKRTIIKATMVKDADWDTILALKEQAAKKVNKETEYKEIKDKLDDIGSKLTEQDYKQLEKEGFPVEAFTVKGLSEAIDRIKAEAKIVLIKADGTESGEKKNYSERLKLLTSSDKAVEPSDKTTEKVRTTSAEDQKVAGEINKLAINTKTVSHEMLEIHNKGMKISDAEGNKMQESQVNKIQTAEGNKAQTSGVNKLQTAEVNKAQTAEANKLQTAEVNKTQVDEVNKAQAFEVNKAQASEVNKKQTAEVNTTQAAELNKTYPSELNKMKEAQVNNIHAAEVNKTQTSVVDKIQVSDESKSQEPEIKNVSQENSKISDETQKTKKTQEKEPDIANAVGNNTSEMKPVRRDQNNQVEGWKATMWKAAEGIRAYTGVQRNASEVGRTAKQQEIQETNKVDQAVELANPEDIKLITDKLKEANLPATTENINKIVKALNLAQAASKIDDKAVQYLISKEVEPTSENIYKACYSTTSQNVVKLPDKTWSDLSGQVKQVIKEAGYEPDETNMEAAKWLLERQLPLTAETFSYKKQLEQMATSTDKEAALNKIVDGMQKGINPKDVSLRETKVATKEKLLTDIQAIKSETITEAVKNGTELTIKKLIELQEKLQVMLGKTDATKTEIAGSAAKQEVSSANPTKPNSVETNAKNEYAATIDETKASVSSSSNLPETASTNTDTETKATTNETKATANETSTTEAKDEIQQNKETKDNAQKESSNNATQGSSYEEVRAMRQLEEIRLKMTLEAASKLEQKGIKVDTQKLSKVVDDLRDLENDYYKEHLKEADVEATEASVQTFKDTTQSIERLRYIPSYVLGSTLENRSTQTIPGLLAEGSKLQADITKAGQAYEPLMTMPNREYGDSIKKAFANSDSLLAELKVENTEQNQRAVRILGYNQMEISQESINQVKAYDLQVNTLLQNLHPAVTVRMIKEGLNPMEMPINELNQKIDQIKEEQGITSEEKFSTYLRKLEKTDGISGEERKAYIGVYRLLYNVEKSDGAALGAVIKADREVTLENLLTAVQTNKKGRLEAAINDDFGTLQSVTRDKETIAEQLSPFLGTKGQPSKGQASIEDTVKEQTEYLDRIVKQLKDEITPEKLKEVSTNTGTTQSQQTNAQTMTSSPVVSSQKGIWETIKSVSVEKLYGQLQNVAGDKDTADEVYAGRVQDIREICKNSEQAIRFLNDYHVPSTALNVVMANHIISNGESPIKKLIQLQKENKIEKGENSLKEINNLSDTLIDKQSMEDVYTGLEMDAKAALNQSYSEEKIDSRKLAELKTLGQQMRFIKTLAENEYYQIPVETDKGITNMNLTILRGTQTSGKVAVTIRSEQLGNVKAEFSLKDNTLRGFISSDNRNGLEQLQRSAGDIEKTASDNDVSLKQMDFVVQHSKDAYNYLSSNTGEDGASMNSETERTLYQIAKAIVRTVRSAENSNTDTESAVS